LQAKNRTGSGGLESVPGSPRRRRSLGLEAPSYIDKGLVFTPDDNQKLDGQ